MSPEALLPIRWTEWHKQVAAHSERRPVFSWLSVRSGLHHSACQAAAAPPGQGRL